MPATAQSLRLTDAYRAKLSALTKAAQRDAKVAWKGMSWNDLSGSYGPIANRVYVSIFRAQTEAVRLTAGYLGAYLSSELGTRVATPVISSERYVGKSYGNLPLRQSLDSPRVSLLAANKRGEADPMGQGLRALLVNVDLDVKHAAREALREAMEADDRIIGWRRAVKGTCDACMGAAEASVAPAGTPLEIHPNCECVSEAVLTGKPTERVAVRMPPGRNEPVDNAVSAIESVHDYPSDTPMTVIEMGETGSAHGDFSMLPSGKGVIRLDRGVMPNESTVIHELGHRVDAALGEQGFLTDLPAADLKEGVDEMQALMKTIRKTDAYKSLKDSPLFTKDIVSYYTSKKELFARAYAQWIGKKTGIKIGEQADKNFGIQWEDGDFAPIVAKMEALFRARGLMK